MAKRTFCGGNEYHGLQEALHAVMLEEDDDAVLELVTIPPESSVLTDEEEGDEDNIHSNDIPRDIPGRVEVFTVRDEEWNSREDETLVETKRRVFHQYLSIDESMVKYFGRHPAKQFVQGKPVRFGYKNWMVTSSDGYCYAFDFYCGKLSGANPTEPLGTRVVKQLLDKLNTNPKDHVVFYNFSPVLICSEICENLDFVQRVRVREGRTKKCPLVAVKEMKKKDRAEFDYCFDKVNQALFVR